MPTVYIAAPYSTMAKYSKEKPNGIIENDYRDFLEDIERVFIKRGFKTYLPHRDLNKWGQVYLSPSELTLNFLERIKQCDIFISYLGNSSGVHIELGYAIGLNKKLIILKKKGEQQSSLIEGLQEWCGATIIEFREIKDLIVNLKMIVKNL